MLRPVYSLITGDLRMAAGCPLFDYFFGVLMNNFKKKIKRKKCVLTMKTGVLKT